MIDVKKVDNHIRDITYNYMQFVVDEIKKSFLLYPKTILTSFDVKLSEEGKMNVTFELPEDLIIEDQNITLVLAHGGNVRKKDGMFLRIPPNSVLTKYLLG